jgi:hypothetical protein
MSSYEDRFVKCLLFATMDQIKFLNYIYIQYQIHFAFKLPNHVTWFHYLEHDFVQINVS